MIRYRQTALDVLFVATEVVAWFMVLRVIVSIAVGTFWSDVASELQGAIAIGAVEQPDRAQALLPMLHAAADSAAGPSLAVVLVAALGAFALERGIARSGMDGPIAAVALLLGSIVGLNIVFRMALDGGWRLWDLSTLFAGQHVGTAAEVDLDALVASGSLEGIHGSAVALTIGGLTLLWIRFLIAARSQVAFPRVLRSVSIGLAVVLVAMIVGAIGDVPRVTPFAVVHFVLSVLALALANNARAYIPAEGETRGVAPWLVAIAGTTAVLIGVAMVIALLAFLNAGTVLAFIGTIALRIIEFVLFLIITPLYWAMERVAGLILGDGAGFGQGVGNDEPLELPGGEETGERSFPEWVGNLTRTLAVLAFAVMLYYLARLILRRRPEREGPVPEVRSRGTGGSGLRDVLRDILPSFRRPDTTSWMARHRIYRLYGRARNDAEARGFHAMEGETPLEFTERAAGALSAPFVEVGRAFDRARYGRHFPPDYEVEVMEQRVAHWEEEMPVTRELRERHSGAGQMKESDEIALRIERRRAAALGDAERVRRLGEDETR